MRLLRITLARRRGSNPYPQPFIPIRGVVPDGIGDLWKDAAELIDPRRIEQYPRRMLRLSRRRPALPPTI